MVLFGLQPVCTEGSWPAKASLLAQLTGAFHIGSILPVSCVNAPLLNSIVSV